MTALSRRRFVGGTLAAGSAAAVGQAGQATAQTPSKFTVIGHRVHQQTLTEGAAGNVLKPWIDRTNVTLDWVTLDLNAIHDRVFREAGLASSDVGVDFVLNTRAVPEVMALFDPIDPYLAKAPIEDFDDLSQGMVKAFSANGIRHGVPYRHAVNAFQLRKQRQHSRSLAMSTMRTMCCRLSVR